MADTEDKKFGLLLKAESEGVVRTQHSGSTSIAKELEEEGLFRRQAVSNKSYISWTITEEGKEDLKKRRVKIMLLEKEMKR